MRSRTRPTLPTLLACLIVATSCAPTPTSDEEAPSSTPTASIGTVEVTNYPLAYVTRRLGAPLLEVSFRAAAAPDPAYWRPTADQILSMQEADLIVLNGASYESWLDEVSLPTSRLVNTTVGVSDRLIAISGTVTHSHGPEGQHEHAGSAFTTWLDPTLLVLQARAVYQALAARWPEHDARFADRLSSLEADLVALDHELELATAGAADTPVLFSHPVYQYLDRRYGLIGNSLHWEPDQVPDEGQWAELDHVLARTGAEWMIWEAEPLPITVEALASRGLRYVVVEPCATPPGRGDLLDVMRRNTEALPPAFQASGG